MKLKNLKRVQETLSWPTPEDKLPVITWETCELLLIALHLPFRVNILINSPERSRVVHSHPHRRFHPRRFVLPKRASWRIRPIERELWEGHDPRFLWRNLQSFKCRSQRMIPL